MEVLIPVSVGELIDKITILEIKASVTDDAYVHKELRALKEAKESLNHEVDPVLITDLRRVNQALWHIEDQIRQKESDNEFDSEFINLAREVYKTNDLRSEIKKKINYTTGSTYREYKSYPTPC